MSYFQDWLCWVGADLEIFLPPLSRPSEEEKSPGGSQVYHLISPPSLLSTLQDWPSCILPFNC